MTAAHRWIARRLLLALPVIAGVAVLTFALVHLAPGDPVYVLAGDAGSPAYYAEMREKYGLDRPLVEQLFRYTGAVLTGDLGYSFTYRTPVSRVLLAHAGASILLGSAALGLATVCGLVVGALSVLVRTRTGDAVLRVSSAIAYSAPVFWTGQLLMLIVSLKLGLLPVSGMSEMRDPGTGLGLALDVARHLVLPAVTLSLPFMALIARVSRTGLLEALQQPFVLAAYARGGSRVRIVLRHAAANGIVPVVVLLGQHAGQIAAGAAMTEVLFGWPGVGSLVLHASLHRDYPLVTAAFIVISAGVVLFNAVTDAACAWLDPRVPLR